MRGSELRQRRRLDLRPCFSLSVFCRRREKNNRRPMSTNCGVDCLLIPNGFACGGLFSNGPGPGSGPGPSTGPGLALLSIGLGLYDHNAMRQI